MRYIRILTVVSWLIMTLSLSPDACRKRRVQRNERNNAARRKQYADDEAYRGEAIKKSKANRASVKKETAILTAY